MFGSPALISTPIELFLKVEFLIVGIPDPISTPIELLKKIQS